MTKEELEKATGQELIEQRDYCGVDGYYGDYLDDVNAEMLKRFNLLAELEAQIEKMKCCGNCKFGCIACGNYLCELLLNNCNSIPFHCDKWEIKEK